MNKKEKIILAISIVVFCFSICFYLTLKDASCYPLREIFTLSAIFSLLLALLDKITLNIRKAVKFVVILSFIFLFCTTTNLLNLFALRFSSVIATLNYNKAAEAQKFVDNNYGVYTHIQATDKNLYTLNMMYTKNSNLLDKIIVSLAQSDIWDESFNAGLTVYELSDNINIAKKRIEKALNKRLKIISGVKSVDTHVNLYKENDKLDSNLTEIIIDITPEDNSDKQLILNTVKRLLPVNIKNVQLKYH